MITLHDVYATSDAELILFSLLKERTPEQSISHRGMPTMGQHVRFVESKPYKHWYLIKAQRFVGAIYQTPKHEVGIAIFAEHRGKGYGTEALNRFRKMHPGPLLANINPKNAPSIAFFTKHGGRLIQQTYEL